MVTLIVAVPLLSCGSADEIARAGARAGDDVVRGADDLVRRSDGVGTRVDDYAGGRRLDERVYAGDVFGPIHEQKRTNAERIDALVERWGNELRKVICEAIDAIEQLDDPTPEQLRTYTYQKLGYVPDLPYDEIADLLEDGAIEDWADFTLGIGRWASCLD